MRRCRKHGCKADENLVTHDGYCPAHRPGSAQRRAATGKMGARVRWPRLLLPPLDSPAAALLWCDVIGRAVTMRKIAPGTASVALRAARVALAAFEAAEILPRLEAIEDRLKEERR